MVSRIDRARGDLQDLCEPGRWVGKILSMSGGIDVSISLIAASPWLRCSEGLFLTLEVTWK